MKWRDIPEDIRKTAEALSEKYVDEGPSDEEVANAILAERQRCAALLASLDFAHCDWSDVVDRINAVAKAIEEGKP